MAADALDLDDAVLEDDESPSLHVQELMEGDVDRLNLLLLDDYAIELERRTRTPKRVTLNEIKKELMDRFKDTRRVFEGASDEAVFEMLTGESVATLYEGCVLSSVVTRVRDRFLSVKLGSGIEGQIHSSNIDMPSNTDIPLDNLFKVNQALLAAILKVNYDRMTVELSARQQDVSQSTPRIKVDQYFDFEEMQQDKGTTLKMIKKKTQRTVKHPYWHSMDYKEAEKYLEGKPRGDVVVRPSTKGNDHVSLTWKVAKGVFKHIDVLEKDKLNDWSLGRTLVIGNNSFNEIDQILAEYIDPMTRRIAKLLDHPKFQNKTLNEMYGFLNDQVLSLKRSAYGFIHANVASMFWLVVKHTRGSARKEDVELGAKGWVFRERVFGEVDDLLAFFKVSEAEKSRANANVSGGRRDYNSRR